MTECKKDEILEILQNGKFTKIINHSKFKLIISILPVKPKLKHKDFLLVPEESFRIDDHGLDLTKISFRFIND